MFYYKKIIIILALILFSISFIIVNSIGNENYLDIYINNMENVSVNYDSEIIKCVPTINADNSNKKIIRLDISSVKPGKTTIVIEGDDVSKESENGKRQIKRDVYVHKFGIITTDTYLGRCRGDTSFILSFYIIFLLIIINLIRMYVKNSKEKLYSYKNASRLGLIIFVTLTYLWHIAFYAYDLWFGYHSSINSFIQTIRNSIHVFIIIVFPLSFILTILGTISNIKLLKREGKRMRNMLTILAGSFICIATLITISLNVIYIIDSSQIIASYLLSVMAMFISYLECVFWGTCVLGIKSAKHIPKFDKDAILILGCRINEDGTLTNLLKARVDRAIEFSNMQKEATGKNILFVPSGGKGSDEIISEAQAMKNYLLEQGIKEENILIEDKSTNTYENIKFSYKLIEEKIKNAKIAFSTTNYHVFRAGILANSLNIDIEGIGAKTKTYYWINAFIREFIGTLVAEKKSVFKTLGMLMVMLLIISLVVYL